MILLLLRCECILFILIRRDSKICANSFGRARNFMGGMGGAGGAGRGAGGTGS